jgi:ribonucleoside-diphosphate reductase alpha chain
MTHLEGIRQKVFMDRYSLKDAQGQPLEFYPEQTWARVARGIASVEVTEEKRAEWEERFYEALSNFQFVPGGRILAGAGTGHQVTYYNCMPPDQEVLTADGYRPISEIKIGDLVVTHRNRLRPVLHKFERETEEKLYIIRPKKVGYDDLRLTGDHKVYVIRSEWVNKHKSRDGLRLQHEPDWIPAKEIKPGDYVAIAYNGEENPPDIIHLQDYISAPEHSIDLKYYFEYDNLKWVRINEIAVEDYSGIVLDIEVEEDHSFISAGVVVSNCFVIPSPEDSRQGILDNLKIMTEIMARGGGVGINLSTLRPRGSYIKTVNGTASGPCSWAQLYSVATGDVIQQGGCFGPDERISTDQGLIRAQELAERLESGEQIQAQTHQGLRPITHVFRNGVKNLYAVTTSRGYRVRVTLDHKMAVLRNGEIATISLRELEEGAEVLLLPGEGATPDTALLPLQPRPDARSAHLHQDPLIKLPTHLTPELAYLLGYSYREIVQNPELLEHTETGIIKLTVANQQQERLVSTIHRLFGITPELACRDSKCTVITLHSATLVTWLQNHGLLKPEAIRVPEAIFRSPSKVMAAFIAGYLEADGCDRNKKGGYNIDRGMLEDIQLLLLANGIVSHLAVQDEVAMVERLEARSSILPDTIVSIEALGPAEVYDFEVEEVHLLSGGGLYVSNSRRGALMLMLDDMHPDIEEFITVKRQPGMIEHANLSVCVSDTFMQAVKDDADWQLIWNGEVKKTIRARKLWDLICTSAWESAEPGLVFMDRCNKEANTWYYEHIRCVNPCVTGDTLIYTDHGLLSAKELADPGTPITIISPNVTAEELVFAGHTTDGMQLTRSSPGTKLRQASQVFPTGIKPVYRLQTREGYTVRLTRDHKVLTDRGWQEAGALLTGDKIILLSSEGGFGPTGNADLGMTLGELIGDDGHSTCSQVPPSVLCGSREMQKSFLSALFTANGSVQSSREKDISLCLTASNQSLLTGVQQLLLNFGIASCISQKRRTNLLLSESNLVTFTQQIGLLTQEKQHKLEELLTGYTHESEQTSFLATFESLVADGEEMVYDLTEPAAHLFVGNGIVLHNCGEQPLPAYGVCNLGAINLSAFVNKGQMDYDRLVEKAQVAMRFLDNVIDANEYFIQENRAAQLGTRRTGLGTMGLADALIKMKVAYGSEESIPVIERIYATIRDAAYEASTAIAAEKGVFPLFERDKYMQGSFIQRLPKHIQEQIQQQGIRNAVLLTQAPTGTTSLLSGVSSGIEPVFDFAMIRRDRTGEHILYHPLLQEWRDKHPNEPTAKYFVSSKDLTPEEHIRVQSIVQRYTDASISKTVNAPNHHTVEQVQTLYRLAYETGCKGVTYYRDGSRDAVLTRVEDEKKTEQGPQVPMIEPVASIQQGIKKRPEVVSGYTRQVRAPEGKINITINSDKQGPFEVFVNLGKAGSDIAALSEALGRLISLNLQILSPLSQTDRTRVIAEQLRGIGGSRSVGFGAHQVRSLPDGVARALELHLAALLQPETEEHATQGSNGNKAPATGNPVSPLNLSHLSVTGNLCSECGCNTIVSEEGCRKCYSCGHSEC